MPVASPPSDDLALQVEAFLADHVAALQLDERPGPGAPRILPASLLWSGLVVCVLRGFGSQSALWRLLTQRGLWASPPVAVTDDAIQKRLARDGLEPMTRLLAQITTLLAARIAPFRDTRLATFASEVVALDEFTLDRVARLLPPLRSLPPGDPGLLGGTVAALFDLRRQQWRTVAYREDTLQNEKVVARRMLEGLAHGALILADLGYFGFQWFDDLTDHGYFWLSRLRNKTSYTTLHTFYHQGDTRDCLIWLGEHRADRAKHAVRLIQFRVKNQLHRYITNVTDPTLLTPADAARLYARRWDIEMAVNAVKSQLGLHLVWSAKPVVIQQQVWAVLLIFQIFSAFRLEVAGRAGVDLFEVSLPLLIEYFPRYAYAGTDPIALFVEHGRELRFIRPSPRTVIQAPTIPPEAITPLPHDILRERTPRYAKRKCTRNIS
jgi:hypothetical protein